ncbi:MAG: hypothetical protein AABX70_01595 [Nanoarchaeota archaeon]
MNKRGAYFFILDAVLSSIIILVTIYFILSLRTKAPETLQSYAQGEDFMEFMMQTQVRDFNGNYTKSLMENGNITNTQRTLFEQMAEFHFYNKTGIAWKFMEEISNSSLLSHQGMNMWVEQDLIYNRSSERLEKANIVLSSKKMSFLRINQSYVDGPHTVEVWIWY